MRIVVTKFYFDIEVKTAIADDETSTEIYPSQSYDSANSKK